MVPTSSGGTLNVINAVSIDKYVRGVIAGEMPSSWPIEALKVQAVAARSYALAGEVDGNGFDLYDDTRSQVYDGIAGETAATDRAVRATSNQVVMYGGEGRHDLLLGQLRRPDRERRVRLRRRRARSRT